MVKYKRDTSWYSHVVITAGLQDPIEINVVLILKAVEDEVVGDGVLYVELQRAGLQI